MQDLGYSDTYAFSMLGTTSLVISIYFIKLLFTIFLVGIFHICFFKNHNCLKLLNFMKKRIFFNEILKIFYECQLEISYASIINIQSNLHSSWGEKFSLVFSYFCMTVIFIIIPLLQIYLFLIRSPDKLISEKCVEMFGVLY